MLMATVSCTSLGAWYGILAVVSQLAVVTNAFLIAVTAQFIPIEVFTRGGYRLGLVCRCTRG